MEVRQVKTKSRLFIPLRPELAAPIATETDRLKFLVTQAGMPLTPNGFYMRFKGCVEAAGLPAGRSPHGLRKSAARRLAEGGCTAHQIASITAHRMLSEVQRHAQVARAQWLEDRQAELLEVRISMWCSPSRRRSRSSRSRTRPWCTTSYSGQRRRRCAPSPPIRRSAGGITTRVAIGKVHPGKASAAFVTWIERA